MCKIFHHNDLDGKCAGAIAMRSKIARAEGKITLVEMDYKDIEGYSFKDVQPNELVIIVDFSFPPEKMKELQAFTKRIIWIDHHETAFAYDYGVKLEGALGTDHSACELAWIYFCPKDKMPNSVRLVGDRDKWAFKYGDATRKFCEGIKVFDTSPSKPIWDDLLGKEKGFQSIASLGAGCIKWRENFCKDYVKLCGHEVTFQQEFKDTLGRVKFYAMNLFTLGSESFGEKFKEYDACIAYVHDGNQWQCSIYSREMDVRQIALALGGGGHPHAAGWVCIELPFRRI